MPVSAPQPLFDRHQMRRNRARWQKDFTRHNALFAEAAAGLLERLSWIKRDFARVLELGSRDDSLASAFLRNHPRSFFLRTAPAGIGLDCLADEEFLPFAPNSFDLILSNLSVQGINDVPGTLIQARRALKPGGFFLAALLGGDSLCELRECLYEAEMELRGGISPRIAPFMDARDGAALLQRAGFDQPVVDRERLTLTYPDAFALMQELRAQGEANVIRSRNKSFTPKQLFARMAEIYRQRYPEGEGIKASFEFIVLSGWVQAAQPSLPKRSSTEAVQLPRLGKARG